MMKKCAATLAVMACIVSGANAGDMGHSMGDFSLSGYVDGEFMAQQRLDVSTPDPTDTGWKSSFGDNSHAVLWAMSDPSQKASFLSEVYYWQATNTFSLRQAAVDWRLHSTESYMVAGRMGKFYYPFGIEGRSQHATTNMLCSRPYVNSAAGARMSVLNSTPDNGVELMGGGKLGESSVRMNWAAAVTNGLGAGLSTQLMDADKNKAVGGQMSFMFMDHYELGGSAQFGKYNGTDNYLLVGAHGVADPTDALDIRGEWAMSQADNAGSLANPDLKGMAFYGQAAWTMPLEGDNMHSFGLGARFAWFDPNTDADNDDASQLAVGLNFMPAEHMNLKLEYDLNMQNVTGTEPDDNAVLAQAVVGW